MKFGMCADLSSAQKVADAGFDYIEGGLTTLAMAAETVFEAMTRDMRGANLDVEAMNLMLPGSMRLTGPQADHEAAQVYLTGAFSRAQKLGSQVQVFGSGGARNVPEGWPLDKALEQLAGYVRMAAALAAKHGISIAIEPLRPQECNIINSVAEGLALARTVNLPNVGVLADWYHMAEQGEGVQGMLDAGSMLLHCHIANPRGRRFPLPADGADFSAFFAALQEIGYAGRVSVEGNGSVEEYASALKRLKEYA